MNKITRQINLPAGFKLGFLHSHPHMEAQLELDQDHVIVDRDEWEKVTSFLNSDPYIKQIIIELNHHAKS